MSTTSTETRDEVVPFEAADGFACNLFHVRGTQKPSRGPVLLVHGAGVSANVFRAPVERTLVDVLLDEGYDVWLENWRASILLERSRWTLDQAAAFDHPRAVRVVLGETGARTLKAVIHCQGSTSFMMSLMAGLLPEVTTVVANAVSLHTVVPNISEIKIRYLMPLVARRMAYMNPEWGRTGAPGAFATAVILAGMALHYECSNPVCKLVSFTYGSGHPALWRHENLNDATHAWIEHEFANVPFTFFEQMERCLDRGHLVSLDTHGCLLEDYVAQPPRTEARFAFIAGGLNRCFLPIGQRQTFEYFEAARPGRQSLTVFPAYSHLDIFMGKDAARDVFPTIVRELAAGDDEDSAKPAVATATKRLKA